jgi:SagB-type dehydrogenase family enzyme
MSDTSYNYNFLLSTFVHLQKLSKIMKRKVFCSFVSVFALFLCGLFNSASAQDIMLPAPQKGNTNGCIMQALQNRHSVRSFSDKNISNQVLSDLLWAANGVNREDGRRTAPSAINAQDIEVYVSLKNGVYHYIATDNKLVKVTDGDLRSVIVGRNVFINNVPVVILLVSNQSKFRGRGSEKFGAMDAGYVSQNICLFCSAFGLGTVPCAPPIDAAAVQKMLNLSTDYIPLIYQPVGYPNE